MNYTCPSCGLNGNCADLLAGLTIFCKKCNQAILLSKPPLPAPGLSPPRLEEQQRKDDEARAAAEQKRLEEQRQMDDEARAAAEQKRLEEQRRKDDEAHVAAEEKRLQEQRRKDDDARAAAAQKRLEEQRRKDEEARAAAEKKRLEEQRRRDEEARIAAEQKRLEEQRRKDEDARATAQQKRLEEQKRKAEEARVASEQQAHIGLEQPSPALPSSGMDLLPSVAKDPRGDSLCHFCNIHQADEAARITETRTKTQRMRRCAECKKNMEILTQVFEKTALISMLVMGVTLVCAIGLSYLIWGWGEYMIGIFMGILIVSLIGLFVVGIRAQMRFEKQLPYKMKSQIEVQKELDQQLTAADLIEAAGVTAPLEIVAAGRWRDAGTIVGSMVASAVFGPLAGTEHWGGFLAVRDRQLLIISFGVVVGDVLDLVKLEYARGTASWRVVNLDQLTVDLSMSGADVVLNIGGATSILVTFPAAFDADNARKARQIAEAIRTAKDPHRAEKQVGNSVNGEIFALAGDTPPTGWSEKTKGAVCFYAIVPLMMFGAVLAFKAHNPMPGWGLLFLMPAMACSIGAIRFRYYLYGTGAVPLAVWCAPITVGLFLIGAIVMAFGGR